jgi:FkbM family methyltransferase|tara:strand:- start:988 stop:1938 length:951 start_codon:yes stop_codon:yes gene_type:complete
VRAWLGMLNGKVLQIHFFLEPYIILQKMDTLKKNIIYLYEKKKEYGVRLFMVKAIKIIFTRVKTWIKSKKCLLYRSRVVNYRGIKIRILVKSKWDLSRAEDGFEKYVLDSFFKYKISELDIYYELGANIGINSLLMAKYLSSDKTNVIAFEPEPLNICSLSKNVIDNDLQNVVIMPFAVSDRNGISSFYLSTKAKFTQSGQGAHSIEFMERYHSGNIKIPILDLDSVIATFNLPKPTLVSIDVEGHENTVLKGMAKILQEKTIRILVIEIDKIRDPNQTNIPSFLGSYGYSMIDYQSSPEGVRPHSLALFLDKLKG